MADGDGEAVPVLGEAGGTVVIDVGPDGQPRRQLEFGGGQTAEV